jgi:SnoaL-like domain
VSQQNVEIARQIFPGGIDMVALVNSADLLAATRAGIEPLVEPDFEIVGDPNAIPMGPISGVDHGPRGLIAKGIDGFLDFWREWISAWESWELGHHEFIDVDENRVLVSHQVHARSKTDGVEVTIEAANLMTLRDGKLARMQLFFNRENAFEAAGLTQ